MALSKLLLITFVFALCFDSVLSTSLEKRHSSKAPAAGPSPLISPPITLPAPAANPTAFPPSALPPSTNPPASIPPSTNPPAANPSPYNPSQPGPGQKVWCIGKPAADDSYLMRNIDYACGEGGIDCTLIQPGGACYVPNSAIAHASYAMNVFYQKNGRNWWTCHFNGTGLVVFTDPSFGNCNYPAQ